MLYSKKSNFAFFLCHSNANHSICMALHTIMDKKTDISWDWLNKSNYGFKHVSPGGYLETDDFNFKNMISSEEWKKISKITTVRNPWSRMYDFYTWHFTMKKSPYKKIEKIIYDYTLSKPSFDEWIKNLEIDRSLKWWDQIFNQKVYRKDCNFVLRYENLNEDFKKIFPNLKIPSSNVSHPNQWFVDDDKYQMNEYSMNLIKKYCYDDIVEFDYVYEGKIIG